MAVDDSFDIDAYARAFSTGFEAAQAADQALTDCGLPLSQPEGWGFFRGKNSEPSNQVGMWSAGDGHTAPSIQRLKDLDDEYFQFVLSWREGGQFKGWTIHYAPRHRPLSDEMQSAFDFVGLKDFDACPEFDFDSCSWRFIPLEQRGHSMFDRNTADVWKAFEAHPASFSRGVERLLAANQAFQPFHMRLLPQRAARFSAAGVPINSTIAQPSRASGTGTTFLYDVAISFASPERRLAESLAIAVRDAGYDVFYDGFYKEQLWGADLATHLADAYGKQARYCVVFVSAEYIARIWPNHERQHAVARAMEQRGSDYILQIRVDGTELPGVPSTIGYLSLEQTSIEDIATLLLGKLKD